jgi:hypothetical protein
MSAFPLFHRINCGFHGCCSRPDAHRRRRFFDRRHLLINRSVSLPDFNFLLVSIRRHNSFNYFLGGTTTHHSVVTKTSRTATLCSPTTSPPVRATCYRDKRSSRHRRRTCTDRHSSARAALRDALVENRNVVAGRRQSCAMWYRHVCLFELDEPLVPTTPVVEPAAGRPLEVGPPKRRRRWSHLFQRLHRGPSTRVGTFGARDVEIGRGANDVGPLEHRHCWCTQVWRS